MRESVLIKACAGSEVIATWHSVAVPRVGETLLTLGGPTCSFTVTEVRWCVYLDKDIHRHVDSDPDAEYVVLSLRAVP